MHGTNKQLLKLPPRAQNNRCEDSEDQLSSTTSKLGQLYSNQKDPLKSPNVRGKQQLMPVVSANIAATANKQSKPQV